MTPVFQKWGIVLCDRLLYIPFRLEQNIEKIQVYIMQPKQYSSFYTS